MSSNIKNKLIQGSRVFNKDSTKYIPIVGWSFWFNEMIFGIDLVIRIKKRNLIINTIILFYNQLNVNGNLIVNRWSKIWIQF